MSRPTIITAVLALLLSAGMTACSRDSTVVTIYSGRSSSLIAPLLDDFAEQTGISIQVRYSDSADLALLISQEGERTPADVFYSQSPGATGFLASEGRLAVLDDQVLDLVDPRFRSADGQWVGVSGRQRVLVYNQEMVSEEDLPISVFDVIDGPLAGQVAVAPNNGSFQDFMTAMSQVEGEDAARAFLDGLVATDAPTYANNNAIVEAVGRGEIAAGLVNHYYNYRFLDEDPALPSRNHLFSGEDIGALVIASPISIIEGTDVPDEARQLVEFLLAAEAQAYFAEETFEYPLARGVDAASGLPPLATLDVPAFDITDLRGQLTDTLDLIDESGLSG